MSELRDRMIQDLKLAALSDRTAEVYLRAVRQLAAYYMTSPDRITERQVKGITSTVATSWAWPRGPSSRCSPG